jgi:hypothetical protein
MIPSFITPPRITAAGGLLASSSMLLGFSRVAGGLMLTTYIITLLWPKEGRK